MAVVAEGLLERVPAEELSAIEGVRITHDSYGHLRLAELDLAYILKTLVEHRFAARGAPITVVHKNIGYELAFCFAHRFRLRRYAYSRLWGGGIFPESPAGRRKAGRRADLFGGRQTAIS